MRDAQNYVKYIVELNPQTAREFQFYITKYILKNSDAIIKQNITAALFDEHHGTSNNNLFDILRNSILINAYDNNWALFSGEKNQITKHHSEIIKRSRKN